MSITTAKIVWQSSHLYTIYIVLLGTILREDDYLIEPIEVVQLLLTNFIQTLNPDLFAKEDRPSKINKEKLSSFKNSENGGPDKSVSSNEFSSMTLNELTTKARESIL